MSRTRRKTEGSATGALILLLLGLACGGLLSLSPDLALPLAIMLLPGLIYLVVDVSPGWGIARAMLLFEAAACVRPVSQAWYQCAGIESCMNELASPTSVMEVWLAGGLAWLIAQFVPIALKLLNDVRLRSYRSVLEARRNALKTEWGIERLPRG